MVCYLFCFVLQLVTTVDVDSLNLEKLDCEYPASSPPYESVSQTTKAAVNMSSLVIEVECHTYTDMVCSCCECTGR